MKLSFLLMALFSAFLLQAQPAQYTYKDIRVKPITHATFQMWYAGKYYLIDPSVGSDKLSELAKPDYIIYTDIHFDHFNPNILDSLELKPTTVIIAPDAVKKLIDEKLPNRKFNINVLANGETSRLDNSTIDAIPMYNITGDRLKFHTKGRGNGYVLHLGKSNIYISGDTEDIPEMRALKHIDIAFLCMNLPYTMDVDHAVSATLAFKPKVVIPYHYRGQGGFSDVNLFKQNVIAGDSHIKVELLKWY